MQPHPYPQGYGAPAPYPYAPPPPAPYIAYPQGAGVTCSLNASPSGVCGKCGAEAASRRAENFRYTPGWAYACYLGGLIVGIVVVAITTKRGFVYVPLCQACSDRWRGANLAYGLSFLGMILPFVGVGVGIAMDPHGGTGILLFLVLLLAAILVPVIVGASLAGRRMKASFMDDRFVTLTGVHPVAVQAWCAGSAPMMAPGYPPPGYAPPGYPPAGGYPPPGYPPRY